jgi:hypothetical protein
VFVLPLPLRVRHATRWHSTTSFQCHGAPIR